MRNEKRPTSRIARRIATDPSEDNTGGGKLSGKCQQRREKKMREGLTKSKREMMFVM